VVREGTPASLTSKGEAGQTAERENFTPPVLHEVSNILCVVVVVELVRARTLSEDGVFLGDAQF